MAKGNTRDWQEKSRQYLEEAANRLLEKTNDVQVYSERALARKIRLEDARLPHIEETAMPDAVAEYLLRRQVGVMVDSARLSKFRAAVLVLSIEGLTPSEIASRFGCRKSLIRRALRIARRRIARRHSPYDGLYEVYWSEVHRHIYRKPRPS